MPVASDKNDLIKNKAHDSEPQLGTKNTIERRNLVEPFKLVKNENGTKTYANERCMKIRIHVRKTITFN